MVHMRVQAIIDLELHNKVADGSPQEIIEVLYESLSERHLRILSKMDLISATEAKSGQLKN